MKQYQAIAAMSRNRVIGRGNQIPWRLPEDFRWFKQMTTGHVVVMGRKTFESLPGPLPNRQIIVLTRDPQRLVEAHPGRFKLLGDDAVRGAAQVTAAASADARAGEVLNVANPSTARPPGPVAVGLYVCASLEDVQPEEFAGEVFICGGAEVYRQALPRCSDLYLTLVKREVEGDILFPPFEDRFELVATIRQTPEFDIQHYVRCAGRSAANIGFGTADVAVRAPETAG